MAISDNILDRDKKAYKENTADNGLDRRVTDVTTQAKLDNIYTALGQMTAAIYSLIELLTTTLSLFLVDDNSDQLVDDNSDNLMG